VAEAVPPGPAAVAIGSLGPGAGRRLPGGPREHGVRDLFRALAGPPRAGAPGPTGTPDWAGVRTVRIE